MPGILVLKRVLSSRSDRLHSETAVKEGGKEGKNGRMDRWKDERKEENQQSLGKADLRLISVGPSS